MSRNPFSEAAEAANGYGRHGARPAHGWLLAPLRAPPLRLRSRTRHGTRGEPSSLDEQRRGDPAAFGHQNVVSPAGGHEIHRFHANASRRERGRQTRMRK